MIPGATLGTLLLLLGPQDAAAPVDEGPAWVGVLKDLKFYGDFRLRQESDFERVGRKDRDRQRLRLRLGVNYQINDQLLMGARVVTGDPDDQRSTHVTLGDGFDDWDMSLDRAFLTYRPLWWEGAFATAGKFNHPFYKNPVFGELVWDADVQPEGAVFGRSMSNVPGFQSVGVTAGVYTLLEEGDENDSTLIVGELRGRVGLGESATATLATSYYYYGDTTPGGSTDILDQNAGNAVSPSTGTPADFESDFGISNTILGINYTGWTLPVTFAAEYIKNTRAEIKADNGWALGVALGSTAKKGDWRTYYQWQVVEQDSVFSAYAQDDFLLTTNHRSHMLGVNYQLTDKIGLNLWGLVSALDKTLDTPTTDSDSEQWRVRLDLNVKL